MALNEHCRDTIYFKRLLYSRLCTLLVVKMPQQCTQHSLCTLLLNKHYRDAWIEALLMETYTLIPCLRQHFLVVQSKSNERDFENSHFRTLSL